MFGGKLKVTALLLLCTVIFLVLPTAKTSATSSTSYKALVANRNFNKILPTVLKECKQYKNVPPEVILAIISNESGFNPKLVHRGNIGAMQINYKSATALWKHFYPNKKVQIKDLLNHEINIKLGVLYFSSKVSAYKNNVEMALTAYNRGDGGLKKYVASRGTYISAYSKSIMLLSKRYKNINSKIK